MSLLVTARNDSKNSASVVGFEAVVGHRLTATYPWEVSPALRRLGAISRGDTEHSRGSSSLAPGAVWRKHELVFGCCSVGVRVFTSLYV